MNHHSYLKIMCLFAVKFYHEQLFAIIIELQAANKMQDQYPFRPFTCNKDHCKDYSPFALINI